MQYMIHKSLNITAEDINDSLDNCYEFEGIEVSIYRAGPLIIVEPKNIAERTIERNPDDYRMETLLVGKVGTVQ